MNPILLLIILVPVIEIYLLIKIGSKIGALTTILLIFFTAIVGVYYAKYEGLNTLRSAINQIVKNEDPIFEIISGVVDTDTYINVINFPFLLQETKKQFLIKKGEPMIQVIPFKRESWKMWSGFYIEKLHSKTLNLLNSEWVDRYKNRFWNKKSFK